MSDDDQENRDGSGGSEPRHPIGVVATRTGLTPSALRAWERRYGVVEPARSEGGQRLYSDADLERLSLLKRVTDAGRAIGRVAGLPDAELRGLAAEDEAARRRVRSWEVRSGAPGGRPDPATFLEDALAAVDRLDARGLEAVLRRAAVALGSVPFTDELMAPLLRGIGDRWAEGSLGVAHEHLATGVVRRVLSWITDPPGASEAPAVVLATLPGEQHEMGAMLAAVTASLAGWSVTYLGQGTPASDIRDAAEGVGARMVGISTVNPAEASRAVDGLAELIRELDPGIDLVLGGGSAPEVAERSGVSRVRVMRDLGTFRELLAGVPRD